MVGTKVILSTWTAQFIHCVSHTLHVFFPLSFCEKWPCNVTKVITTVPFPVMKALPCQSCDLVGKNVGKTDLKSVRCCEPSPSMACVGSGNTECCLGCALLISSTHIFNTASLLGSLSEANGTTIKDFFPPIDIIPSLHLTYLNKTCRNT